MRYDLFQPLAQDLDKISPKECYSLGEVGCSKTLIEMSWAGKTKDSICMAFAEKGIIAGIVGSYRNWAGCAQAWAVFDGRVDSHPVSLTKVCLTLIKYAQTKQELRRLSLTVRSGYDKGDRFAKTLGFALEGEMKMYLPDGGDACLYARTF